jgi:hypothetical protein
VSKITESAKGKDCTIRIPGICNFDPDTVVHCHINTKFKGTALKSPDIFGFRGCSSCHDVIDGRNIGHKHKVMELKLWAYDAVIETQKQLMDEDIINVK